MCGIAGIIAENSDAVRRAVPRMTAAMIHRGPDDGGEEFITAGRYTLGLGFRRLSILDLSPAGHQPMRHPETGDLITFNGEIYNFALLRAELEAEGVQFRGHSDTEVLLHALVRRGPAVIARLEGMYAFAWYSPSRNELLLCRDALGIKPLYIAATRNGLLYGSELRVISAAEMLPRRLDRGAAYSMLAYGAVPEPRTILEGVSMLPPGSYQVFDLAKPLAEMACPVQRYWSFPRRRDDLDARQAVDAVRTTLAAAVRDHLVSDVPVGVFLSSGIDSTIMAAIAADCTPQLRTFTVAFADDPEMSEGQPAAETARRIGAQHTEIQVNGPDALAAATRWLESLDQPSVDGLNTYVISQAVRKQGIVVALSGLGGDELFGGYSTFANVARFERLRRRMAWLPSGARRTAARLATLGQPSAVRQKAGDMLAGDGELISLYTASRRALSDQALRELGADPGSCGLNHLYLPPAALAGRFHLDDDLFAGVSQLEAGLYMSNQLLRDSDTNGMAHSLEIRVPLLDRRLLDLAFALPGAIRRGDGIAGKALLRAAFPEYLPPGIAGLAKRGFTLPVGRWMVGPLRELCESGLDHLKRMNVLRSDGIDATWGAYRAEPHPRRWARAFSLCVLGLYCRRVGL